MSVTFSPRSVKSGAGRRSTLRDSVTSVGRSRSPPKSVGRDRAGRGRPIDSVPSNPVRSELKPSPPVVLQAVRAKDNAMRLTETRTDLRSIEAIVRRREAIECRIHPQEIFCRDGSRPQFVYG
ncbi:hypothetical protein [Aureimonas sp. AU12]|uniref:hypothetical protein n=1 Tax=Aureimonas sp. AU12 TaxID=1638161 RepID=UPI00178CF974|nr:hypothetical protein [Aureimonas sp. AU12]